MTIQAVLFDMDGLLFNSEFMAIGASELAGAEQGYDISEPLFRSMLGTNKEKSTALLRAELPQIDPAKYWSDFDKFMWKHVEEKGLPVKPCAEQLLKWLKEKDYVTGLCSGSPRHVVEGYLRVSGFDVYFDSVLAGDDDLSLRSKPAPDMYAHLAEKIGILPGACLVLEDSPNGLRAGRAAGMQTVMVPDLVPYSEELAPYCDAVYPDLSYVIRYLERQTACPCV